MLDYAQGAFQVDYEARVDLDRLRVARVTKAQGAMRAGGLDALVLREWCLPWNRSSGCRVSGAAVGSGWRIPAW